MRLAEEFFGAADFPTALRSHTRAGRAAAYLAAGEYAYAGLDLPRARRYLLHGVALSRGRVPARLLGIALRSLLPRRLVERGRARRTTQGTA